MFIRKGMRFGNAPSTSIALDYLCFAGAVRYAPRGRSMTPYFVAGPEVGYLLFAEQRRSSRKWNLRDELADFDFSLNIGAGLPIVVLSQGLFIEARYAYGLVDMYPARLSGGPRWNWKTRGVYLLIGMSP
jgi:hypothetical protein